MEFTIFLRLTNSPIVAFGRSLGGAVSVYLAEKFPEKVAGVVLENTFLSVGAMVDKLMPVVASLKSLVLRIKWDSDEKIKLLKQPIMFISGLWIAKILLPCRLWGWGWRGGSLNSGFDP